MCEPNHSIVQFPDQDPDSGNPTGGLAPTDGLLKRILRWFHFSRMGRGHSEGLMSNKIRDSVFFRLGHAKFEAQWWDRKFRRDGYYGERNEDLRSGEAFDCALEYANRTSIGSLDQVRRFLEASMLNTDRPDNYVSAFYGMLNPIGRDVLHAKEKFMTSLSAKIKILCGMTRKRGLLVPEWADDQKLWIPKGGIIMNSNQ